MLSYLPLRVIEEAHGKILPVILEDATGVSAKTWKKGGPTLPGVISRVKATVAEGRVRSMRDAGFGREEIATRCAAKPLELTGVWQALVLSGADIGDKFLCETTLELATRIDSFSATLSKLHQANDLVMFRDALLSSDFLSTGEEWLSLTKEVQGAREQACGAKAWSDLQPLTACVSAVVIFQFLACWDVEFFTKYLTDPKSKLRLEPKPLFAFVMPKLNPKNKPKTDGSYSVRGIFLLPLRRVNGGAKGRHLTG